MYIATSSTITDRAMLKVKNRSSTNAGSGSTIIDRMTMIRPGAASALQVAATEERSPGSSVVVHAAVSLRARSAADPCPAGTAMAAGACGGSIAAAAVGKYWFS